MDNVKRSLLKREGVIKIQATNISNKEFAETLLKFEQYLNGKFSSEIFLKFGLGVRFHV